MSSDFLCYITSSFEFEFNGSKRSQQLMDINIILMYIALSTAGNHREVGTLLHGWFWVWYIW